MHPDRARQHRLKLLRAYLTEEPMTVYDQDNEALWCAICDEPHRACDSYEAAPPGMSIFDGYKSPCDIQGCGQAGVDEAGELWLCAQHIKELSSSTTGDGGEK